MKKPLLLISMPAVIAALAALVFYLHKQQSARRGEFNPVGGGGAAVQVQPPTTAPATNQVPGKALPGQNAGASVDRLKEIKAATEAAAGKEGNQPTFAAEPEPKMSATNFIGTLGGAVSKADFVGIRMILEKTRQCTNCVDALKDVLGNEKSSVDLRRYAAEALVRTGSKEGVEFVLDQVLAANRGGDSGLAESLRWALDAPTSAAGAQALFDLLLKRGHYAGNTDQLSEELRSALRNTIRMAPDREEIGNLAAGLYRDAQSQGRNDVLVELFDGVSHPAMLSALAAQAYQEGSPQTAGQFLDRIVQINGQDAVQALVQVTSRETALLNGVAERIYAWSLQHRDTAQPGLFLEYLTDSTLPPQQRIAAAYGLVGIADTQLAASSLASAIDHEKDPGVKASFTSLQGMLAGGKK